MYMLSSLKETAKTKLHQYNESKYEKDLRKNFKRKNLKWCDKSFTKEQENEIQDFYIKNLGYKIDLSYHTYWYSRTGIFSPLFVPSSIYKAHVVGRVNDMRMKDAYIDKNQYENFFTEINHPKSILKCINGYFYHENSSVDDKTAVELCSNLDDAIIKPSLDSIHGTKVISISTKNGELHNGKRIEDLFKSYGTNFIVQERINQHERMSALNPTSVNTVRLLTYRRKNNIELLYSVIRIGRKGKIIDNESSGGVTTKINRNGRLEKKLYAPPSEGVLDRTDSGIIVEGYQIPSYEKVVNIVKTLHYKLPYFDLAGWDIAIAENGEPIFIEWNARTELSQTAAGPAFGEYTEEILYKARTNPTTRYFIIGKKGYND